MTKTQNWIDDVATAVQARLTQTDLPLKPKRVEITDATDMLGDEAWRLLLVLPKPDGPTWERDSVYRLRRRAIEYFDEAADSAHRALPGLTIAFVTTDEADEEDIAVDTTPESYENPGTTL